MQFSSQNLANNDRLTQPRLGLATLWEILDPPLYFNMMQFSSIKTRKNTKRNIYLFTWFTCLHFFHQNKQDNPGSAKSPVSFITSLNLFLVTNPPCFHIMSKHTVCKQLVWNLLVWNNRDKPTISSIESTTGSLQFIYSRYWTFSTESDTMDNLQSLHCEHAPLKICNHIVWISLKEYIDLNQSRSNSTSKA